MLKLKELGFKKSQCLVPGFKGFIFLSVFKSRDAP